MEKLWKALSINNEMYITSLVAVQLQAYIILVSPALRNKIHIHIIINLSAS